MWGPHFENFCSKKAVDQFDGKSLSEPLSAAVQVNSDVLHPTLIQGEVNLSKHMILPLTSGFQKSLVSTSLQLLVFRAIKNY